MTVALTKAQETFSGNGSATAFVTNIYAIDEDQIEVVLIENAVRTEWTLGVEYSLDGLGDALDGVTINATTAPAEGQTLEVSRSTARVQELDISNSGFDPSVFETQFDRLVMMLQEVGQVTDDFVDDFNLVTTYRQETLDASEAASDSETAASSSATAAAASRAAAEASQTAAATSATAAGEAEDGAEAAWAELQAVTTSATTLVPGSDASANYADGVFSFGIPRGDKGDNFNPDAIGFLSELSDYDAEAEDFSFLARDTGDMYFRETATAGTWSDPVPWRGEQGPQGPAGGRTATNLVMDPTLLDDAAWSTSAGDTLEIVGSAEAALEAPRLISLTTSAANGTSAIYPKVLPGSWAGRVLRFRAKIQSSAACTLYIGANLHREGVYQGTTQTAVYSGTPSDVTEIHGVIEVRSDLPHDTAVPKLVFTHTAGEETFFVGDPEIYDVTEAARDGFHVDWWGADPTGTDDSQPAFQAAVDWLVARGREFTLRFSPGEYLVNDETDLSAVTKEFTLRGMREGTILAPSDYGPAKAVLRPPSSLPCTIEGFQFGNGTALKNHPIGIPMREAGRISLRDITGGGLGNTVLFCTRPFNADWQNLDLMFNGWQPVHREVDVSAITLTLTADSSTVTASAGVFEAGDVGKDIQIYHDPDANEAIVANIATYVSATEVTLDRNMVVTGSGRRFSFGAIVGTATGTSLTFPRDIGLEAADVGRMIYVDRAGADGRTHVSQIAAVTDGSTCTLEDAVTTDGTWRVFFTPTIYIGSHDIVGTGPNDIYLDRVLVEGFKGPGILVDGGLHVKIGELKTHGRTWGEFSNFGQTCEALIWGGAHKSRIDFWEMEFCGKRSDGGVVRVAGDAPGLSIGYMSHNSPLVGGYLFDWRPTDTLKSSLRLPEINGRTNLDRFDGLLKSSSTAAMRRVDGQRVSGASVTVEASVQMPQVIGSARALAPIFVASGASFTFKPASPAGVISVASEDSTAFAGVWSYMTATNGSSLMASGGAGVSATLGTASSLNLDCINGDSIEIQNNTGADRRFYVFIGG